MAAADLWQLYRIASQYYREGKTQEEISAKENISRSQVSRHLEQARRLGIVKIDVSLPTSLKEDSLTGFLERNLKLERVILASVEESSGIDGIRDAIAETAAANLPKLLKGSHVIGLGWGETMYRTASALPHRTIGPDPVFVPLIGASGSSKPSLQINTIIDRFSEHLQGDRFFVNLPAFREKDFPLTTYENKRLRLLKEYWESVDTAIIGLGNKESGFSLFEEEVSESALTRITRADVVGDILSQFFFEDGTLLTPDESYHTNAYPAARLRTLSRSICLAGGREKVVPLLTAARAGYFKTLITDTRTAHALYEQIRREIES